MTILSTTKDLKDELDEELDGKPLPQAWSNGCRIYSSAYHGLMMNLGHPLLKRTNRSQW